MRQFIFRAQPLCTDIWKTVHPMNPQLWSDDSTRSGGTVTITRISYNASPLAAQLLSFPASFNDTWHVTNTATNQQLLVS